MGCGYSAFSLNAGMQSCHVLNLCNSPPGTLVVSAPLHQGSCSWVAVERRRPTHVGLQQAWGRSVGCACVHHASTGHVVCCRGLAL